MIIRDILKEMKATNIPDGESGLWYIFTKDVNEKLCEKYQKRYRKKVVPGRYKFLMRYTESTMHLNGEVVMNDLDCELKTHFPIILQAKGKVFISGLGLGCVARGLLCNDRVEKIDVAEISEDVIKLVKKYMPQDKRLCIHHCDAFELLTSGTKWDYAWHDLWTDMDSGEKHVIIIHYDLLLKGMKCIQYQGCWGMRREDVRMLRNAGARIIR